MEFVRRHLPRENGHKYAPLGQGQDAVPFSSQQKPFWTRKYWLIALMLVLLAGMAFVVATR